MKKIVAVTIVCLLSLDGFSQFPFYTLLPSGGSGLVFGDTVLNTSAILQRQGIRKITAVETLSARRKGSSFTTTYLVNDGKIQARYWCYRPAPDTAFRFCTRDTLLYNSKGVMQEYHAGNSEDPYLKMTMEPNLDESISTTLISKDPRTSVYDTSIYHQVYNAKGQLVSQHYDPKARYIVNASLYYNPDGLPDSIRHENPAWGTYVFTRKKKGNKKEIALETHNSIYRWVYNAAGQCVSSYWSFKKPDKQRSQSFRPLFTEVTYSYNDDGTLSKVVEKKRNDKVATIYTYSR